MLGIILMDLFTDQYFFFSFFLKTRQKKFNILFSCQPGVIPVFVLWRLLVCSVSHSAVVESVDSNGTAVSSLPPRSPPTGPWLMVRKTLEYLGREVTVNVKQSLVWKSCVYSPVREELWKAMKS